MPERDDPGPGSRHYQGAESARSIINWKCSSCGANQVSRFEDGCPSCGAGTAAQAAAAQAPPGIPLERLRDEIVGPAPEVSADYFLALTPLRLPARMSVAAALAHYADHGGQPTNDELPRQVSLAWARWLMAQALEELDGRGEAPRDESGPGQAGESEGPRPAPQPGPKFST